MYWADYLADTGHLTTLQHGAYLLLIAHYWKNEHLPVEEAQLARIARMDNLTWSRNRDTIADLFGDDWTHWRIEQELEKSRVISCKRRASAHKMHSKCSANAVQMDTQLQSHTHKKDIEGNSGRKKAGSRIPDGWLPKIESVEKAQKLGFSPREITREAEKFKNHAREKDRRAVLWDAAFDNWVINAAGYQNKSPPSDNSGGFAAFPNSPEFQAWRSFARDGGKSAFSKLLDQREMEGRPFNFESRWPPGFKNEEMNGENQASH